MDDRSIGATMNDHDDRRLISIDLCDAAPPSSPPAKDVFIVRDREHDRCNN